MNGRIISATFLLICLSFFTKAQNFNYSVSADTSGAYAPLSNDIVLTADSSWKQSYTVQIGFSFPIDGKTFTELTIEKNSYLIFDKNRSYAMLAFAGFSCKKDEQNHYSKLSYVNEGASPNRVLKIQYNNVGQSEVPSEYLNYQIWLYENGRIDLITGAHTYSLPDSTNYNDTLNAVQIGLINPNMDTSNRGLFLSGGANNPGSEPVNDSHTYISFIRSMPLPGTRYSFIPNN